MYFRSNYKEPLKYFYVVFVRKKKLKLSIYEDTTATNKFSINL